MLNKEYRILDSAFKHGITESEIDSVLSDMNPTRRIYDMHDDKNGVPQDMYVAHTGTRPWAIEVSVAYRETETVIFHANRISNEYRKFYEGER